MKKSALSFTGFLGFGVLSMALTASADPAEMAYRCELGDLSRNIYVNYKEPGSTLPCEVMYQKGGEAEPKALWTATTEEGYCEVQAEGLAGKLSASGWECTRQDDSLEPAKPNSAQKPSAS